MIAHLNADDDGGKFIQTTTTTDNDNDEHSFVSLVDKDFSFETVEKVLIIIKVFVSLLFAHHHHHHQQYQHEKPEKSFNCFSLCS